MTKHRCVVVIAIYRTVLDSSLDPAAIEADLPIGSGEVESSHRYIIQERLKLSGAWWKIDNARAMLALRLLRANNQWQEYWENLMPLAA